MPCPPGRMRAGPLGPDGSGVGRSRGAGVSGASPVPGALQVSALRPGVGVPGGREQRGGLPRLREAAPHPARRPGGAVEGPASTSCPGAAGPDRAAPAGPASAGVPDARLAAAATAGACPSSTGAASGRRAACQAPSVAPSPVYGAGASPQAQGRLVCEVGRCGQRAAYRADVSVGGRTVDAVLCGDHLAERQMTGRIGAVRAW